MKGAVHTGECPLRVSEVSHGVGSGSGRGLTSVRAVDAGARGTGHALPDAARRVDFASVFTVAPLEPSQLRGAIGVLLGVSRWAEGTSAVDCACPHPVTRRACAGGSAECVWCGVVVELVAAVSAMVRAATKSDRSPKRLPRPSSRQLLAFTATSPSPTQPSASRHVLRTAGRASRRFSLRLTTPITFYAAHGPTSVTRPSRRLIALPIAYPPPSTVDLRKSPGTPRRCPNVARACYYS